MNFVPPAARPSRLVRSAIGLGLLLSTTISAGLAHADGLAYPGEISMQAAATPIAEEIHVFHNWVLLPIITAICLLVLGLLAYVIFRFNDKANTVPSQTTHHTGLEVAWTIFPVLVLVVIAIPSFRLLTHQLVVPPSDLTVKVTGKQWYWSYNYPADQGGGFEFDSTLIQEADLKPGDVRLLSVDNEAVVPVGKVVHVLVTADDVIHSFTIPSFGIRIDAVPGRTNETWFKAEREGIYYGQCSKLCGKDHAYMPIAFRVVSEEKYADWLASAKKKFASADSQPIHLAQAH
ncbi:cytochrome c oxidase subunit II [Beijerinckia mobilis]|uniref:cytochrome c oxidase subunit II n=1 Tax=Beijerinckia mobilis TaxID=231434 RepID=UPI0005581046|nr:cytochrome c oxidase subunit II [Beijerinckia mobilis]